MSENTENVKARNQILSSLTEVFKSMERIDDSLIAVRLGEARWAGVFAFGLFSILWAGIGIPLLSVLFPVPLPSAGNAPVSMSQFHIFGMLIPFLSIAPLLGILTYFYARKSYTKQFVLHKESLKELIKAVEEQKVREGNVIEKTLKLMDQMSGWLLKLLRYKSNEALGYGFIAFLIIAFISFLFSASSVGFPISMLVGVIVWLYFRNEKRKEVEGQIQEFKLWKQKFEEGKTAFLDTV